MKDDIVQPGKLVSIVGLYPKASSASVFAGLTKLMSKLSKEGDYDKALDIYYALPELGIRYDTTITNAAISSCDKGP